MKGISLNSFNLYILYNPVLCLTPFSLLYLICAHFKICLEFLLFSLLRKKTYKVNKVIASKIQEMKIFNSSFIISASFFFLL